MSVPRGKVRRVIKTVEAVIDEQTCVRLLKPVAVPRSRRALVTILEEEPAPDLHEIALVTTGHHGLKGCIVEV